MGFKYINIKIIIICLASLCVLGCHSLFESRKTSNSSKESKAPGEVFGKIAETVDCPSFMETKVEELQLISAHRVLRNNNTMEDLQNIDLSSSDIEDKIDVKNKVVIVRLIGTWCPFCKNDLIELYNRYLNTDLKSEVEVILITNSSRRENQETVTGFRDMVRNNWGVSHPEFFHLFFVPGKEGGLQGFERLAQWMDEKGNLLFPEYRGVPYAMVFDRNGELRLRGTFTSSEQTIENHYQQISALIEGGCASD